MFASKKTLAVIAGLIILLAGVMYTLVSSDPQIPVAPVGPEPAIAPVPAAAAPTTTVSVIGASVQGREIEAYSFGTGATNLLFVGGVHGGYEWNSILLAYTMIDHLRENPELIPDNVTVRIIPDLNPDGLFIATGLEGKFTAADVPDDSGNVAGTGRYNANSVDLNRNFDCKWAQKSTWRGATVSAGTAAFSEPEAIALRDYVATIKPKAVLFWHSQANHVYGSECEDGILPGTLAVMNAYSAASSYGAIPSFDAYPVTGDAEGWLASIGIPAVTVELSSHHSIEWDKNLAGTNAVIQMYGK